jgi:hypothetical protein
VTQLLSWSSSAKGQVDDAAPTSSTQSDTHRHHRPTDGLLAAASANSSVAAFTKRPGVEVETPRVRSSDWQGGPVLACWPSAEHLAQLVQREGVTALCVLGWNDKDVSAWMAHAKPEFLSPGVEVPAGPPRLDPMVVAALVDLSGMVNHANGLAGVFDHRDAVRVLNTLHAAGYAIDGEAMFGWAVAHEWPASGARRLRDLSDKIQSGVRPRVARGLDASAAPHLLAMWRERIAEGDELAARRRDEGDDGLP